jgi:hypothetical protein
MAAGLRLAQPTRDPRMAGWFHSGAHGKTLGTGTGSTDGIDQALVKVVAHMADDVRTGSHSEDLRLTLNSDGHRHPVLNAMTVFTFVGGIVAFACGLIVKAHAVGAILGIVAFVVGMITQMNSATREERVLTMAGIIAAFVGLALGIAHGGFY